MYKYIVAFLLLGLCDLFWILPMQSFVTKMFMKIQGEPPQLRLGPAFIVYVALAYLVNRATSIQDAFILGSATYAVYDFTNLATVTNYSPYFAVADTLWGGVLMAFVRYLLNQIL